MISKSKQFLFIHVPKTGGNSIQSLLRAFSDDEITSSGKLQDGFERFGVFNRKYNLYKHATISHYRQAMEKDVFDRLTKFAVIRNPWDAMVSWYFSPSRGSSEWKRGDFLSLVKRVPNLRQFIVLQNVFTRGAKKIGIRLDWRRGCLDQDIDFLLKFETLDDDFKTLCRLLDIPHRDLPVRNKSERQHYSRYYDSELKDIVEKKFHEEIEFGHYQFERK